MNKAKTGLFRAGVPVLILLINLLSAQDLETVWMDVINLDARLNSVRQLEINWQEQQHTITAEIQSLQKNQTWYNGWFYELALARKNTAQVRIADSLQKVQESVDELIIRREDAFRTFKMVYQQLVLTGQERKALSESEKEQAITLGRWWINQRVHSVKLPDYASILNNPYEDPRIRRLVTRDLQLVLRDKLGLIDSLIKEQETTEVLLDRLNEFHADLGLEMDANLELIAGGSRVTGNSYSSDVELSGANYADALSINESKNSRSQANFETTSNQERFSPSTGPLSLLPTYVNSGNLNLLKSKREEYRHLLERIEKELKP